MKLKLFTFLLMLYTPFVFAFPVTIRGYINPDISKTIKIRCAAWVEEAHVNTGATSGNLLFKTDIPCPAEFTITVGDDPELSYNFFVFEKSSLAIDCSDPLSKAIIIQGEPARSRAFAKVGLYFQSFEGYEANIGDTNLEYPVQNLSKGIKMIPDIGDDAYTDMIANCAALLMLANTYNDGWPAYNIRPLPVLQDLMKDHDKFSGFELYNNLVWPVWLEQLKDEIRLAINEGQDYVPHFKELLDVAGKRKKEVSHKTFVNAKYGILMFVNPETLSETDKSTWLEEVQRFCNDYPQYTFTPYLGMKYEQAVHSLTGAAAPDFSLRDINGKQVELSDFAGKYLLIDVWGSWCLPCRQMNKELVAMYSVYQNKNLDFVSIAYDKDITQLKRAVKEDKLSWQQLVYNEQFLKNYNIFSYPTLILISPDQKIIKIAHHIDKAEIDVILKEGQ